MQEIISRADALRLGLKRYFTGNLCKKGHIATRLTSSRNCDACVKLHPVIYGPRLEHRRKYREENRDRINAARRASRAGNPQKERETYAKNAAAQIAKVAAWRKANPEKYRSLAITNKNRRRAREAMADGENSAVDRQKILSAQKNRCAYCRKKLEKFNINWDHIVPISKGGSNDRRNIQALCSTCNRRKGAIHPIEFAQKIGMLL